MPPRRTAALLWRRTVCPSAPDRPSDPSSWRPPQAPLASPAPTSPPQPSPSSPSSSSSPSSAEAPVSSATAYDYGLFLWDAGLQQASTFLTRPSPVLLHPFARVRPRKGERAEVAEGWTRERGWGSACS